MTRELALVPEIHLFLFRAESVLLLLRANTGYEDEKYCAISGHVESEEIVTAAVIREAQEEVGVKIDARNLQFCHVMQVRADNLRNGRVAFFFACSQWAGRVHNMEPDRCDSLEWFPRSNLPHNTIPYIHQALQLIPEQTYSEYGWE